MPIQQHPIPQNVTQYQFRLIGDMTLKQFLQLAGGIVLGMVFYALPLPFFLKWPLIAVVVGLGAGMAFLPVEGRPLDQWILAFIRSVYSPTIYVWKKKQLQPTSLQNLNPANFTTTVQAPTTIPSTPQTPHARIKHPSLVPEIHTLIRNQPPQISPIPVSPEDIAPSRKAKTVFSTPLKPIKIERQPRPETTPASATHQASTPTPHLSGSTSHAPGSQTVFSAQLPIPHTPTTPNTIVGMTLTPQGRILDSSIIEIKDKGITLRATKSNKLGQFLFAKPLENGHYQLTAEKDGYVFPVFNLDLKGEIVSPIELRAKA